MERFMVRSYPNHFGYIGDVDYKGKRMKRIFNEQGFLNKDGEKATAKLKFEIEKILDEAKAEDIQTLGCILHKMVGDAVANAALTKRELVNKFNAMSDAEFDAYLKAKYEPLVGEHWFLKAPLTEEEGERISQTFTRNIQKWMEEEKNKPREQHYGLRLSPRHKPRFR